MAQLRDNNNNNTNTDSPAAAADARDIVEVWLPILRRLVRDERSILRQVHYILDAYHTPLLEQKEWKRIITFMQHWTLFSNIKTLFNSQEVLVDALAAIVSDAERLISAADAATNAEEEKEEEGKVAGGSEGHSNSTHPTPTTLSERVSSPPPPLQFAGMQTSNTTTPPPTTFHEIVESVLSLFCGPSMRHFIAEHMMFSLNYSRTIAPELLKISRVFAIHQAARRRPGAMTVMTSAEGMCEFISLGDASQKLLTIGALSEGGVPQLGVEDKEVMKRYQAFLQYVYFRLTRDSDATSQTSSNHAAVVMVEETNANKRRATWSPSKGNGGTTATAINSNSNNTNTNSVNANNGSITPLVSVEDHSQTPASHSPSKKGAKAPLAAQSIPGLVQAFANIFPGNQHVNSSSFHGAFQGPRSGTISGSTSHKDGPKTGKDAHPTEGFAALEIVLPTLDDIPHSWNGLHKLLGMLSAPLPSLRRYLHVARCLIEAQSPLSLELRHRFQTDFIDVAALRIAEESSLVLDQILQQDVTQLLGLMEESGAGDRRIVIRPCTDGSRVLVHYGRVVKRFRRGRHERLMFLFSDWLCYVEELSNGRLRLRGSIPLQNVVVNDVESSLSLDIAHCFEVVSNDTCLVLFAVSHTEKCIWMDAIRGAVSRDSAARKAKAGERGQQSGDVERMVRSTAPPVPTRSRLHRQRAYDARVQQRMEELTSRPPLQELKRMVARQNMNIATELKTEDDNMQPSQHGSQSEEDDNENNNDDRSSSGHGSEYDESTEDTTAGRSATKSQHAREMSSTTRSDGAGASFSSGLSAPQTALATRRASRTSMYRTGTPRTHSSDHNPSPFSSPPVAPSLRRTLSRSQFQSFDVSHWAQPSNGSTHRRMRSTEVLQQFTRTFRSDSMHLDDEDEDERGKAQQSGSPPNLNLSPEASAQLPKEILSEQVGNGSNGGGTTTPVSRPVQNMLKTPTRLPQPSTSGRSASTPMRSAELSGRPPIHPPLAPGTPSPTGKEGEPSEQNIQGEAPDGLEAAKDVNNADRSDTSPIRVLQLPGLEDSGKLPQSKEAAEAAAPLDASSFSSSSQASTPPRTPSAVPTDQKVDGVEENIIAATEEKESEPKEVLPSEGDAIQTSTPPTSASSEERVHSSIDTPEHKKDNDKDTECTEETKSETQPSKQHSTHVDPATL